MAPMCRSLPKELRNPASVQGRKLTLVISFWGSALSKGDARSRHLGDRVRPTTDIPLVT